MVKMDLSRERLGGAIEKIGATSIRLDENLLADVRRTLQEPWHDRIWFP